MQLVGTVLVAATLTSGCTSGDGVSVPLRAEAVGSRFQQDPVVPENGTAPDEFVDRDRLPSCGSYAWTLDDDGPPENMWRCLAESREKGDAAELIVQSPGVDSTVVSYYRVTEDSETIEVWVRDTMGDRWWHGACTSMSTEKGPGPCQADGASG